MKRSNYTVHATRSAVGWILHCREFPSARVEVSRLLDASTVIRPLIADAAGLPMDGFDIELHAVRTSLDHPEPFRRRRPRRP